MESNLVSKITVISLVYFSVSMFSTCNADIDSDTSNSDSESENQGQNG